MNSEPLCMGRKQRTSKRNDANYFNDRKYLRYKIKINHRVVIDYNLLTAQPAVNCDTNQPLRTVYVM